MAPVKAGQIIEPPEDLALPSKERILEEAVWVLRNLMLDIKVNGNTRMAAASLLIKQGIPDDRRDAEIVSLADRLKAATRGSVSANS